MDVIILKENSIKGKYGKYSAIDPVLLPDGTYMLPKRCLTDKDLAEAKDLMIEQTDKETSILDLPEIGEQCLKDVIYKLPSDLVSENLSPNVVCIQTHDRTIYNPKDTPALFSFFRENSDILEWIPNEWVEIGWKRVYGGATYEVIQAHQTLETWTPDVTASLWTKVSTGTYDVFVQPTGSHDAYNIGDIVWFPDVDTDLYESLIDANVWSPTTYPQGWKLI